MNSWFGAGHVARVNTECMWLVAHARYPDPMTATPDQTPPQPDAEPDPRPMPLVQPGLVQKGDDRPYETR
jgi:hypothetical protein